MNCDSHLVETVRPYPFSISWQQIHKEIDGGSSHETTGCTQTKGCAQLEGIIDIDLFLGTVPAVIGTEYACNQLWLKYISWCKAPLPCC